MRGMSNIDDSIRSAAAHLTSFSGSDCVAVNAWLDQYYINNDGRPYGFSVPATEHSVMCIGEQQGEKETIRRLIQDVYPSGVVSIVSDSWDFWKVIGEYAADLKDLIMSRDGKVVFRPDSGDPVKIICGDPSAFSLAKYGAVEVLWDIFGGTRNEKGYKVLDPHVGLIYGDSITMERAMQILQGLEEKGFASSNIVFGIGSFTYQRVTRDTFGFAMKATHGIVNGKAIDIVKSPKTDTGMKKSAAGLLRVEKDVYGKFHLFDRQSPENEKKGELKTVFKDGTFYVLEDFDIIRNRLRLTY
jgi:nicotinamide phosphoribosyltransferase